MSWKIADIIDFEWFLAEDADVDEPMLRARDREIFAQISRGADGARQFGSRQKIFRAWLEARRTQVQQSLGDYYLTAWRSMWRGFSRALSGFSG